MTSAEAQRYATAAARPGRKPHPERYSSRSLDNPLYRAQLAHARLCREVAHAVSVGVPLVSRDEPDLAARPGDLDAHTGDLGTASVERLVATHPSVARCGGYALTRYMAELSTVVLAWLETAQLWPADPGLAPAAEHETRCAVAEAARIVIASSLTCLGVTAPERI